MIYFVSGRPWIDLLNKARPPVVDSGPYQYQVVDGELRKLPESASEEIVCNWFSIGGDEYRIIDNTESYQYSCATEDNLYLVNRDGNKLDMPLEIVYLLRRALVDNVLPPYVVGSVRGYQEKRGSYLLLANYETRDFFAIEDKSYMLNLTLLPDGVYGYDNDADSCKKYDLELNEVWAFKPDKVIVQDSKKIVPCGDSILFYNGDSKVEQLESIEVPDRDSIHTNHIRLDGELYCLDRETGEMRWQRNFPVALTDFLVHEDQIYCIAEKEIFRLSPETGEIQDQAGMDFNTGTETNLHKLMQVVEDKLWIMVDHYYHQTFCLLVLDPVTLSVEHVIDTPAPFAPDAFLAYDADERQVYFRLSSSKYEAYTEHQHILMVIGLDRLDQAAAFESKPDIDVGFQPAPDDDALEELWIHIKNAPLDKALRFGIVETQNQTAPHSTCPCRQPRPRKTFNGKVHFRYSDSDSPKAEVEKVLSAIESSFNTWVDKMDIGAGDRSGEPVTIDVAYAEN